jgi:hypothetical protein
MLADTLRTFQDFAGLDSGSANCCAVLTDAGQDGDVYLVGVAALWIFLRLQDSRHAMSREQLHSIIKAGGGAMLTVNTATREGGWQFQLYEMPRWPAVVAPYRATRFDRRRRFR